MFKVRQVAHKSHHLSPDLCPKRRSKELKGTVSMTLWSKSEAHEQIWRIWLQPQMERRMLLVRARIDCVTGSCLISCWVTLTQIIHRSKPCQASLHRNLHLLIQITRHATTHWTVETKSHSFRLQSHRLAKHLSCSEATQKVSHRPL